MSRGSRHTLDGFANSDGRRGFEPEPPVNKKMEIAGALSGEIDGMLAKIECCEAQLERLQNELAEKRYLRDNLTDCFDDRIA